MAQSLLKQPYLVCSRMTNARLNEQFDDDNSMDSFVLRRTSFNSARTLTAGLNDLKAISNDML